MPNGSDRHKANSKSEKMKFTHSANRTKEINLSRAPRRGGIRL